MESAYRSEALYRAEREMPGVFIPRWLGAKTAASRGMVSAIDTKNVCEATPKRSSDDAPETPLSPRDDDSPLTPKALLPSTNPTTGHTCAYKDFAWQLKIQLQDAMQTINDMKRDIDTLKTQVSERSLPDSVWMDRYLAEVVRHRDTEEKLWSRSQELATVESLAAVSRAMSRTGTPIQFDSGTQMGALYVSLSTFRAGSFYRSILTDS
jgi:hypothetical protein